MDPLLSNAQALKKKGLPPLTLLAGILIGVFLYQGATNLRNASDNISRKITERGPLSLEERATVDIFESSAESVVFITSKRRGYLWSRHNVYEREAGTGSGFVWDNRGHIVTNFHVLQGGNAFEVVMSDQSSYDARVVGSYPDKDLAVLRIDAPADKLKPIPVGTTKDLKVGQKVLAIGNPFGLDQTLTTGIVSALNRTLESVNGRKIEGAIQTDAAINPGNSGGPLLDSAGRLIGVNTQIYSTSGSSAGIGFAIPVDAVNKAVPQLITYGKVIRPGLGIYGYPNNPRVMLELGIKGLLINDVQPGSAADKAGLRGIRWRTNREPVLGDIILRVNDEPITSTDDLAAVLDRYEVGEVVTVTFLRDGREQSTEVKLQAIE